MKFIYLIFVVSLIAGILLIYKSGLFNLGGVKYKEAIVTIRATSFEVEVADTLASRELGLGGREGLEPNQGMLFVFSSPAERTFWMKDVKFPIDIIWIVEEKVVGFAENTTPHTNQSLGKIARYISPGPVDMVLEVEAGTVRREGIIVGDGVAVDFGD